MTRIMLATTVPITTITVTIHIVIKSLRVVGVVAAAAAAGVVEA